jgi:8-oxo-dGTP pyrophosphatase MutT (NUDIX family)
MHTKPLITHTYENFFIEYYDVDSFDQLPKDECSQCYGISFHGDKLVIVNNVKKGTYTPIGGSIEDGEGFTDTLIREIKEESNMKVLYYRPIGYQRVIDILGTKKPFYQLRYFCVVEPYGPFVFDPAGCVTEIKEIDPKDYKKYFDWGEIGNVVINRAVELKTDYETRIIS